MYMMAHVDLHMVTHDLSLKKIETLVSDYFFLYRTKMRINCAIWVESAQDGHMGIKKDSAIETQNGQLSRGDRLTDNDWNIIEGRGQQIILAY